MQSAWLTGQRYLGYSSHAATTHGIGRVESDVGTGVASFSKSFGLTVGEPTRADVEARNLPDLIPVRMDGGRPGFWRSSEVYTYAANGEVETMPVHINVYGPDGKTIH